MNQSGVFRTGLLVYEDCRLHHERKDMQLEKIPKWNLNNEDTQYISIEDTKNIWAQQLQRERVSNSVNGKIFYVSSSSVKLLSTHYGNFLSKFTVSDYHCCMFSAIGNPTV